MRVYHFVPLSYGLDDIRRRRIKIATFDDLNDPFELFGINLSHQPLRDAFRTVKDELTAQFGLICFSRSWRNPVQWSHYAEKHRGLCLGFDFPDTHLLVVNYSRRRLPVEETGFLDQSKFDEVQTPRFMFTKFSHWKYENEVRAVTDLKDRDPDSGLYFADFSDQCVLQEIIVGADSPVSRREISEAVGDLIPSPAIFKGRLAFASFRVVRQKNERLWQ
jgi:hypothetical protein